MNEDVQENHAPRRAFLTDLAQPTASAPPNFPPDIALYQQAFQNWSGEITIPDV